MTEGNAKRLVLYGEFDTISLVLAEDGDLLALDLKVRSPEMQQRGE